MTSGTLIDANLLCLMVVGRADPRAIGSHPRLRAYDPADRGRVDAVLARKGAPVLCPHVLAETSNLLCYRQPLAQQARWLGTLARLVTLARERTEQALAAVADPAYPRFGITDAVLLLLARDAELTLFSDDLLLCTEAERRGLRVVNYSHLRDGAVRLEQL